MLVDGVREIADPLCRFYTQPAVGDLLVSLMGRCSPRRVVDLGAGDGSLSAAASSRWRRAEIVTVDMDDGCTPALERQLSSLQPRRHVHVKLDALEANLPSKLLNGQCGFDAAICNPPYLLPKWRSGYERILAEAGLAEVYGSRADVSLDALFLAQNLRLTRPGGRIGFIIPDGLATGRRAASLRCALLAQHKIECVVQLPRYSFRNTDAQAYILVFAKAARSASAIRLMRFDRAHGLSKAITISRTQAEERMDYDFHKSAHRAASAQSFSLQDLNADVVRGSLSSAEARRASYPVFHTCDFSGETGANLHLPAQRTSLGAAGKQIMAGPGDILIARVDRLLHRKIAQVVEGYAVITDCVFRIRIPAEVRPRLLGALSSEIGGLLLASVARGVGARMISKRDLLRLPLPFEAEYEQDF
jgi:type I restriction enzyme M protein